MANGGRPAHLVALHRRPPATVPGVDFLGARQRRPPVPIGRSALAVSSRPGCASRRKTTQAAARTGSDPSRWATCLRRLLVTGTTRSSANKHHLGTARSPDLSHPAFHRDRRQQPDPDIVTGPAHLPNGSVADASGVSALALYLPESGPSVLGQNASWHLRAHVGRSAST